MKKIIALVICLTFAAVCFAQADPAVGFWLSIDEKTNKVTAGWEIYLGSDGKLYGKILSLADEPRGTIADQVRESYRGFPLTGKVNEMQVAGPPWIFGLVKNEKNYRSCYLSNVCGSLLCRGRSCSGILAKRR